MIAEIFGKAVCKCAKCGNVSLEDRAKLPKSCRNQQCRTRKWNADAKALDGEVGRTIGCEIAEESPALASIDWPKPVAELADTGEPYKRSEQSKRPGLSAVETFQQSLCIHGIYKPLCRRCQAA